MTQATAAAKVVGKKTNQIAISKSKSKSLHNISTVKVTVDATQSSQAASKQQSHATVAKSKSMLDISSISQVEQANVSSSIENVTTINISNSSSLNVAPFDPNVPSSSSSSTLTIRGLLEQRKRAHESENNSCNSNSIGDADDDLPELDPEYDNPQDEAEELQVAPPKPRIEF